MRGIGLGAAVVDTFLLPRFFSALLREVTLPPPPLGILELTAAAIDLEEK